MFASKAADNGLLSKIYKQLMKLNIKKQTTLSKTEQKIYKRHFSKEDIQMAKKHMKRSSTLLITREMQNKTIVRYHLTLVRLAIITKSTNNMLGPNKCHDRLQGLR